MSQSKSFRGQFKRLIYAFFAAAIGRDRLNKIRSIFNQLGHLSRQNEQLERIVRSQTDQIERLKSRVTLLDSKFRLAVYGLPDSQRFRAQLISNELLWDRPRVQSAVLSHYNSERRNKYRERFQGVLSHLGGQALAPRACLDLCFVPQGHSGSFRQIFPHIERYDAVVEDLTLTDQEEVRTLETHPLTALLAASDGQFNWILGVESLERFTPEERGVALKECVRALQPGGVLYLELPNVLNQKVSQDLFWAEPRNVRLFSLSELLDSLNALNSGSCEWGVWSKGATIIPGTEYCSLQAVRNESTETDELELFVVFVKSGKQAG